MHRPLPHNVLTLLAYLDISSSIYHNLVTPDVYAALYSLLTWAKTVEDMSDDDIPLVHSVGGHSALGGWA